jgi:hypothetical protein
MWHPVWREDGSAIYNCCWFSAAQSFWGPSPTGLMTTFYCLRLGTPPTWRARSPVFISSRHWVLFSSPPTTRWATVGVFDPSSTRKTAAVNWQALLCSPGPHRKRLFHYCVFSRCLGTCPQSCALATAVYCRFSTQVLLGIGSTCHSTTIAGFSEKSHESVTKAVKLFGQKNSVIGFFLFLVPEYELPCGSWSVSKFPTIPFTTSIAALMTS